MRHPYARYAMLVLILCGCTRTTSSAPPPAQVADESPKPTQAAAGTSLLAITFEGGLSAQDREDFYHLAEGSEVFPLDWLRSLESIETGKPFLTNIERFGFLPNSANSDGLPVGLSADEVRGLEPLGRMVGINCAACHVGELTHQGKTVRIDGAPGLVDTRSFFKDLVESAFATIESPDKLLAFLSRRKEERGDQPGAATARRREFARKLIAHLAQTPEEELRAALGPIIKQVIDAEMAAPPFDLAVALRETKGDAALLRKRLLGRFDAESALSRIEDSQLLRGPLKALEDRVDRNGVLTHALEEVQLSVRLMRSRIVFLKKLGMVGKDERTVWGPGRVDAFGSARAFLFQDDYAPLAAVSYPYLWGIDQVGWYHYDGNTTSILERNLGQALGVGAVYDPETSASTLKIENLHRLEQIARKIKPPVWPEDVLGKIDRASADRGAKLFATHCAKCHATPSAGQQAADLLFTPETVGTDPIRAQSFAEKLPDGTPFFEAIRDTMAKIRDKGLEDIGADAKQREEILGSQPIEWRSTGKYAARPLVGIWATGPYLHNGSVPTLDDLLRPAKERPTTFYVGSREYDSAKLGFVTHVEGQTDNFNTSAPGNSNAGHEYGTTLTPAERRDLLEYLKTH